MLADIELRQVYERIRSRMAGAHWKNQGMLRTSLMRVLNELEIADAYTDAGQAQLAQEESGELPGALASYGLSTDEHNAAEVERALTGETALEQAPPGFEPEGEIDPNRRR